MEKLSNYNFMCITTAVQMYNRVKSHNLLSFITMAALGRSQVCLLDNETVPKIS